MSYDLIEDEMEFRGGTLQLSSENPADNIEGSRNADEIVTNRNTARGPSSSVLSGADTLSTSSSQSLAGKSFHYLHLHICYPVKCFLFYDCKKFCLVIPAMSTISIQ